MFSERLRYARKRKKLTQEQLAAKVSTTKGTISNYENGYSSPSNEMLIDLAEALEVTTDFLLGNDTKEKLPELTPKEERDIAKDLEKILSSLDNPNEGYSHFDGQSIDDLDEEDRELLKAALETSMKIAKQIAKKKYTPKKYRKNDD
ncbi:helix-turn-helix transcriptional regulator [Caldifermentibacillus hisashii]|uniref:helix-turn-helix domain-containing protein n=1 Tax=Caldifermentibacillus hisashii TaxID=996558 RepID=UPI0031B718EE